MLEDDLEKKRPVNHRPKFSTPWNPVKRLTRYQMDHLRSLYNQFPELWTKKKLAEQFGISVDATRKILHSKWVPSPEVAEKQDREAKEKKLQRRAQLGIRPKEKDSE